MTQVQRRGTARDVLGVPAFRRIFIATFISNAGRWMQMTSLGVLGWELTESPTYLGLLIFAQLAPMSVLSLIGGSLADTSNRRNLLLGTQSWQMAWTLVLAALVIDDVIAENLLLLLVFIIGIGQGLYAPIFTSILPVIAGADNIKAAVSLNSIQLNAARVIGPAVGGLLASAVGFAEVFAINGVAYLAVLFAIWRTEIPMSTAKAGASFTDRVFGGFRVAWRAPQVGRPLLLMSLFAFFCLPFIGQLPAIAELNLGIDAQATEYGWFYATFGLGGMVGAALVGTVLANVGSRVMIRIALAGFALTLAWLGSVRDITVGYSAIFAVAVFYFAFPPCWLRCGRSTWTRRCGAACRRCGCCPSVEPSRSRTRSLVPSLKRPRSTRSSMRARLRPWYSPSSSDCEPDRSSARRSSTTLRLQGSRSSLYTAETATQAP